MGLLGDLIVRVGADIQDFTTKMGMTSAYLNKLQNDADTATKGFDRLGARLEDLGSQFMKIGASLTAAVTVPLVGIGVASLEVAGKMEQAKVAFANLLGSAQKAGAYLNELRDFAMKTPFELPGLISAAQRLQAMGFAARDVIPTMRAIGDAVAAIGGTAEVMNRVVTAFGQIKAKGTLQAEEMKQLAEAGIPAWEMLAKTLNTSVANAMKLVEARTVSADTALKALQKGIEERFGGMMEMQSKTLAGMWSNFKDQITKTLDDIGQALLPLAKNLLSIGSTLLGWVADLAKAFSELPQPIQMAIVAVAGLAAAVGPLLLALGGITTVLGSAVSAFAALAPLMAGFGITISSLGPAAAGAALAIMAIVEAVKLLTEEWKLMKNILATEVVKSALDATADAYERFFSKLGGSWAKDALAGLNAAVNLSLDAIKKLGIGFTEVSLSLLSPFGSVLVALRVILKQINDMLDMLPSGVDSKTKELTETLRKNLAKISKSTEDSIIAATKAQFDAAFKDINSMTGALDKLSLKSTETLKREYETALKAYEVVKAGNEARGVQEAALKKVKEAYEALYGVEEKYSKSRAKDFATLSDQNAIMIAEMTRVGEQRKQLLKDIAALNDEAANTAAIEAATAAWERMVTVMESASAGSKAAMDNLKASSAGLVDALPALREYADLQGLVKKHMEDALRPTKELDDALKTLHVRDASAQIEEMVTAFTRLGDASGNLLVSTEDYLRAWVNMIDGMIKSGETLEPAILAQYMSLKNSIGSQLKEAQGFWKEFGKEINKVVDSIADGFSRMILDGQSFADTMKNILLDLADSIIKYLVKGALNDLINSFGLLGGSIKTTGESLKGFIGLFGGGAKTVTEAAKTGADAAKNASDAIAKTGSTGTGFAGAGVAGWMGAISSAVSAITDILGYFQTRRMEQDLGRVEVTTRQIEARLRDIQFFCTNIAADTVTMVALFWDPLVKYLQLMTSALESIAGNSGWQSGFGDTGAVVETGSTGAADTTGATAALEETGDAASDAASALDDLSTAAGNTGTLMHGAVGVITVDPVGNNEVPVQIVQEVPTSLTSDQTSTATPSYTYSTGIMKQVAQTVAEVAQTTAAWASDVGKAFTASLSQAMQPYVPLTAFAGGTTLGGTGTMSVADVQAMYSNYVASIPKSSIPYSVTPAVENSSVLSGDLKITIDGGDEYTRKMAQLLADRIIAGVKKKAGNL